MLKNNNFPKFVGIQLLKKSKFYKVNGKIREHIGNYKCYGLFLKQELLKEKIEDDSKNETLFISLIKTEDIPLLKKINGNIVRRTNPETLHKIDIMKMMPKVMEKIDALCDE